MDNPGNTLQPLPSRSSASSKSRRRPSSSRHTSTHRHPSLDREGATESHHKSSRRAVLRHRHRKRSNHHHQQHQDGNDADAENVTSDVGSDDASHYSCETCSGKYPESYDSGRNNAEEHDYQDKDEDEDEDEDNLDDSESQHRSRRHRHRHRDESDDNDQDDQVSMNSTERHNTLKDRQDAINKQHPFGLPLWKPALYKKSRSIVRKANSALHSSPSSSSELFLHPGNIAWLIIFGWWLSLVMFLVSIPISLVPPDGRMYGLVLREFSLYLLWPFGRYVERLVDIVPTSMSDASPGLNAPDSDVEANEYTGLLDGQQKRHQHHRWFDALRVGPAGIVYYALFFTIVAPLLFLVSAICWMCVITIPMAKLNYILMRHLRRHPLSLRFRSSPSAQAQLTNATNQHPTVILLCTYQAIGWQYYKYTYDGINIIYINLIPMVFFVIFDEYVLKRFWPDMFFTRPAFIFGLSLTAVIPLSYFIGMGVSSVSAQSSMGVGAVINATFGSIIEIILYGVALINGKSTLLEGAIIGSLLAGVLLMPGCSMVSGGFKRKEQKFNAKSAGVTATMLIMAIIGALSPTLFYQMFGSFELRCIGCPEGGADSSGSIQCTRCFWDQMNPIIDPVYQNNVKPFMWLCAAILPSAYLIGLVFSLHTHADMVWKTARGPDHDNPATHPSAQNPINLQNIIPTHVISHIIHPHMQDSTEDESVKAKRTATEPTLSSTATWPDGRGAISRVVQPADPSTATLMGPAHVAFVHAKEPGEDEDEEGAGHDSPNWSKFKSFTVLIGCTILYSIIAEILVDTVDIVLENLAIDEKFLGLTLFALVPNITEFMNAISFALYGNIVLSMEIGSAYALQVCLIQIPAMVAFSLWYNRGKDELARYTFSLVFPRWDVISVIFSVFLLTYTYQEGKSNYFKGMILILSYFVLLAGFYYIPSFSGTGIVVGQSLYHASTIQ